MTYTLIFVLNRKKKKRELFFMIKKHKGNIHHFVCI